MSPTTIRTKLILVASAFLLATPVFANSLAVNGGAAMDGTNFGLQVTASGTSTKAFVADDSPAGETVYRIGFWVNPNDIVLPNSPPIVLGRGNAGNSIQIFLGPHPVHAELYQLVVKCKKDSGPGGPRTGKMNFGSSDNFVEFEWVAGDGSNNGTARLWRNGLLKGEKTGIDNDDQVIDSIRLGFPQGTVAGTSGSIHLDEFSSFRTLAP